MFRFFVDSSGWPTMQYKVSPTDPMWSPIDGPLINLWKVNPNSSPNLPTRVPSLVLYCPIWGNDASRSVEREKFISFGLSKYVDFWKVGIAQSSTYEMKMKPYVEYWEDVLLHLSRPLPLQSTTLLEGFWLSSNWRFNYARVSLSTMMNVVDPKDPIQVLYCGPKNMKPLTTYMPFRDFNVGDFVFVKLPDPDFVPL
jgi:hypothetical protein